MTKDKGAGVSSAGRTGGASRSATVPTTRPAWAWRPQRSARCGCAISWCAWTRTTKHALGLSCAR